MSTVQQEASMIHILKKEPLEHTSLRSYTPTPAEAETSPPASHGEHKSEGWSISRPALAAAMLARPPSPLFHHCCKCPFVWWKAGSAGGAAAEPAEGAAQLTAPRSPAVTHNQRDKQAEEVAAGGAPTAPPSRAEACLSAVPTVGPINVSSYVNIGLFCNVSIMQMLIFPSDSPLTWKLEVKHESKKLRLTFDLGVFPPPRNLCQTSQSKDAADANVKTDEKASARVCLQRLLGGNAQKSLLVSEGHVKTKQNKGNLMNLLRGSERCCGRFSIMSRSI